jgi:two-component system KDP operon response regulator KdpE
VHTVGSLEVDVLHHEARLGGAALKLTPTEFALLKALTENAGRIVTQNQLIRQVWGPQQASQTEGLRVHINHLRRKLSENGPRIVNEPGIGYRLMEGA